MIDIVKLEHEYRTKKKYPNFRGFSRELMPKIVDGREIGVKCLRIYVYKKVPKSQLKKAEIFPAKVDDTPTDVVEFGNVKALQVDKTAKFNPIPLGVSIGHWDITAGSLGMLYTDENGILYAGSNAHVLTEDPTVDPSQISETRILEPGAYHNALKDQVAGQYHLHEKIKIEGQEPSNCPIAKIAGALIDWLNDWLLKIGSNTYFPLPKLRTVTNNQDFAVYVPAIPHTDEIADGSFDKSLPFIGHLFAGSEVVGIICKAKYAIQLGFMPIVPVAEVQLNDEVVGCSFWCNYKTRVIDPSAIIQVGGYGNNQVAIFDDVALVANDNVIRGGWSGSGWRKVITNPSGVAESPKIIPDDMIPTT